MNHVHVDKDGEIWGSWGSCQYDSSVKFFNQLLEMNFLEAMEKSKFKFIKIFSLEEGIKRFQEKQRLDIEQWRPEVGESAKEYPGLADEEEETDEKLTELLDIKTVEDCFTFGRESAWDLWGTAPEVLSAFIEGADWSLPKKQGQGLPIVNQWIQDNLADETGFICWICYMFLNCDEEAFCDFDT